MAAKLKKRALAEYQTQTQPAVGGEPSKRLRLVTERSSSSSKEEEPDSLLTVGPETGDKEVVEHVVNFTAELTQQHSPDVLGHLTVRVDGTNCPGYEDCTIGGDDLVDRIGWKV